MFVRIFLTVTVITGSALYIATCRIESQQAQLSRELAHVKFYTTRITIDNKDAEPADSLHEMMVQWGTVKRDGDPGNPDTCRSLKSGVDPWGTKFIYRYDKKTRVLLIRSCGPNEIDDNGNKDDIQKRFDFKKSGLPLRG